MSALGLDLSLTSTGMAQVDDDGTYATMRVKPRPGMAGHERMNWLVEWICDHGGRPALVLVEGPSYGNQGTGRQSGHHERAGLWWLVTNRLYNAGLHIVVVPPAALKRYATGKGNAGKDDVLREVVRRFPAFTGGNDEADALVLAAMGADRLGWPPVAMPATHRSALEAVDWAAAGYLAAKEG